MKGTSNNLPTWLISRPDRVGDVIIATSCLEPIRRQRPEVRLAFAARETMRPLLEGHPLLDRFVSLAQGSGALAGEFRGSDALVHLHPDRPAELGGWRAGVPRRIGRRSGWLDRWTLTDRLPDPRREGRMHEAQYNFDLLAPLGIVAPPDAASLRPAVHLAERWRESLTAKTATAEGDFCVLNPTAFSPVLRWPAEAFARLAMAAAGRLGRIVLVGERADDPALQEIRSRLGPTAVDWVDLSGQLNLAELGWLLHAARVLVSRNTGAAHLAAAVGCPVVELFGRREPIYGPGRWRALGPLTRVIQGNPGERRRGEARRAHWRRGYEVITVEEVLAAALEMARPAG